MRIAHFGMVCLLATVSGSSAVIFQDNFDSEPSNGQLIYTTFINFNVTNGSVDLLGPGAFEGELVRLHGDSLRLDRFLGRIVGREGGAGRLDDRALSADHLLQHLALLRLRLANARRRQSPLEDRHPSVQPDRRLRARAGE